LKKRLGRPRKYTDSATRYYIYDQKRPRIRVSLIEKLFIDKLRGYPEIINKINKNPDIIDEIFTNFTGKKKWQFHNSLLDPGY